MIKVAKLLLVVFFLAVSSCYANGSSEAMNKIERQEIDRLMEISAYVVTDLVGEFYGVKKSQSYDSNDLMRVRKEVPHWPDGKFSEIYIRDKIKDKGFTLLTRPVIEEKPGVLVQINPRTESFVGEVMCLHREEIGGAFYEFWIVKYWHESKPIKNIYFAATTTSDLAKRREPLLVGSKYFNKVVISKEQVFRFPEDDLAVLYNLKAWQFPDAFAESNLRNKEVLLGKNRAYISRKYNGVYPQLEQRVLTPQEVESYFSPRDKKN
jgi:hypothetical protein